MYMCTLCKSPQKILYIHVQYIHCTHTCTIYMYSIYNVQYTCCTVYTLYINMYMYIHACAPVESVVTVTYIETTSSMMTMTKHTEARMAMTTPVPIRGPGSSEESDLDSAHTRTRAQRERERERGGGREGGRTQQCQTTHH